MEWENVRRVREPVAWILLIVTGIGLLIGISTLLGLPGSGFFPGTSTFEVRAGSAVSEFVGSDMALLPVFAVLLVTVAGGATQRAGRVVLIAGAVQSAAFVLGLVSVLGTVGSGSAWYYLTELRLLALAAAGLILTSAVYLSWRRRTGGDRRGAESLVARGADQNSDAGTGARTP